MGIGTSSSSGGDASKRPRAKCLYALNRDASELRRSRARKAPPSAQPGPMHVIYSAEPDVASPAKLEGLAPSSPAPPAP
jgi:hypothetical protein